MKAIVVLVGIAALLYGLDRLLLACERRGWIYWRKNKSSPGSLGSAFLEIHSLLEPGKKHILSIKKEEQQEDDDEGEPPV